MATPVWIGLGSNLGDRRDILDAAIVALAEVPGVVVQAVSSFHETKPIGGPPGQGPFLNAAAQLETTLDPFQLLAALQRIENEAGRVRVVRWGERTLDLDILIFGTKFLDTRELKLPHPRMALRRFVLAPLVEIAPQIVDTMTKRTIADLLANLDRKPRLLALEGPSGLSRTKVFEKLVNELPGIGIKGEELEMTLEDSNDPFPGFIETLQAKINVLRTSRWDLEALQVPWIVTNFSLGFDFRRAFSTNWWRHLPREARPTRQSLDHKKRMQVMEASAEALKATFVVTFSLENQEKRRPGVASIPCLCPESNDPEAIVAEVVATCRGIEAV